MTPTGFLLIDKPSSWTSHDVVAKARRITGIRKVGHAGTLDPMATGLIVLGIGRATKLLRFVQGARKEYVARIRFGIATDSLDADGTVTEQRPMPISRAQLQSVLAEFHGELMQVPPMVSALKHRGKRLHELAREGIEVERPPRSVMIHGIELGEFVAGDHPEAVVTVTCGAGTYIRSLADDIARALGGRAHLIQLRRTANGPLGVDDAVTPAELEALGEGWIARLLDPAEGLGHLSRHDLSPQEAQLVRNGGRLPRDPDRAPGELVLMLDGVELLAVYRVTPEDIRSEVGLT